VVRLTDVRGSEFESQLPDLLQTVYRGRLLSEILGMERKTAISFENAVRLLGDQIYEEFWIKQSGRSRWYELNFVEWIADLGYHIEITGDEFEASMMSDKLV